MTLPHARTPHLASPDPGNAAERSRWRAGAHELVDDRIHERLKRGIDDVGRDTDRRPTLAGFVLALDQHAGDCLGPAVEDAHAVVGQLEPADVALVFAEVFAQRKIERVDGTVA